MVGRQTVDLLIRIRLPAGGPKIIRNISQILVDIRVLLCYILVK